MRAVYNALVAAGGIAILSACTGGQSHIEPPFTAVNVQSQSSLQFRVGTVRFSDGTTGLNTVETFRQPNGLSAVLVSQPIITLPSGLLVPNNAITAGNTDVGTNQISGTPQTQPGTTAVVTTFGTSGGAFSYGFAPANATTGGAANFSQYVLAGTNTALYRDADSAIIVGPGKGNTMAVIEPSTIGPIVGCDGSPAAPCRFGAIANSYMSQFYVSSSRRIPFLLGPPAVPDFHSAASGFPVGFLGYDSGFTTFALAPLTPTTGTYSLTVNVPSNTIGQLSATFTQAATLTSAVPLGAVTTPVTTPIPGGGASFFVAPGPASATNQLLYVVDISATSNKPTFYTFNAGAAGGTFVLSPTSGPGGAAPFRTKDSVYAYVVASDYDILAAAPPLNSQPTPTVPAQADVSVSLVQEIAY